ncbi:TetR/AcrR family transcriptional regulator [Halomicronema sp. CCY15110]|uniref:TetR/AcrR family transcriptional regulator n=1 Tax=Halomicronema sp. CCY15110 TaxID=2767773 RepID=UPI001EF196BC|nr:TetR/AcrR family transcriptional regulator [Halomicronema sp. CCY15110]
MRERSEKARAVLEGAFQVFMAQGYAAASMDRIAATAGVSKSTLYSNFQDKEGLFLALMQEMTFASRQEAFALLSQADLQAPPQQVLRQIAVCMLDSFEQNQPLLTLMRLVIGESDRFPEVAKTFVTDITKPMLDQLTLYLSSQTQLQLPDPVIAARIFAGSLVHYLIIQKLLHGDDVLPLERDRMIDGLIGMITAQQSPAP